MASMMAQRLEDTFHAAATGLHICIPPRYVCCQFTAYSIQKSTAFSELCTPPKHLVMYVKAKIYGRCHIHKMVMNLEIERIEQMYETLLERREWLFR